MQQVGAEGEAGDRAPGRPREQRGDGAASMRDRAQELAEELQQSRVIGNVAWGAMIRAAQKGGADLPPLVCETPFRWIQWGWLE